MKQRLCSIASLLMILGTLGCERPQPRTAQYTSAAQRYGTPAAPPDTSAATSPTSSPDTSSGPPAAPNNNTGGNTGGNNTAGGNNTGGSNTGGSNTGSANRAPSAQAASQVPPDRGEPVASAADERTNDRSRGAEASSNQEDASAVDQVNARLDALASENQALRQQLNELLQRLASQGSVPQTPASITPPAANQPAELIEPPDLSDAYEVDSNAPTAHPPTAIAQDNPGAYSAEYLNPRRRYYREVRATTDSVDMAKFFGSRIMTHVMPDATRIPANRYFPAEFDAHLEPSRLQLGDRFSIGVIRNPNAATFGPVMEGGGIPNRDCYFECVVEGIGEGHVPFIKVEYFVMPHPNRKPDHELAVPVSAVLVNEPINEGPDWVAQSHERSRVAGALGQLLGGIEPNFHADAAATIFDKVLVPMLGEDKTNRVALSDETKQHTPCFVRINSDVIF